MNFEQELSNLKKEGLGRRVRALEPVKANFASNDYLALSTHPLVRDAVKDASEHQGPAAASSRVLSGTCPLHLELEEAFASWKGVEASLVFGCGYLANLGVLSSTISRQQTILADKLIHASLIDGARLSRANLKRFRHNDLNHLESLLRKHPGSVVITESVFSMDGDQAPLPEITSLTQAYDGELIVDEAHGLGVLEAHFDVTTLRTATLSKAFGSYGGLAYGRRAFVDYLIHRARSFIYNTGLPPTSVAAALASLRVIQREASLGQTLLERAQKLRTSLHQAGVDTLQSSTQIIPIVVPGNDRVQRVAKRLLERGYYVPAIRSPTVPRGTERLRISVTLAHDEELLRGFVDEVLEVLE